MYIRSQKDFLSGLMFIFVGVAFAFGTTFYKVGNSAHMGPGYFPLVLGLLLSVLGVIITLKALVVKTVDGEKIGSIAWKPLFFIILSNLVFGVCIGGLPSIGLPPPGLIVGIVLLTFISSYAGEEFKIKEVAILALILSLLSYLAFIVLLKQQFTVWPAFITG